MRAYTLGFQDIDRTRLMTVGGKGANLGELSRIDGIRVPDGFCVTTEAYIEATRDHRELGDLLDALSALTAEERDRIGEISARIRAVIEGIAIPDDMAEEIAERIERLGARDPFAVRSSATAEDLPTASFAGQQDTYLNVIGTADILKHIGRCWGSLFTERAVIYRLMNGFDHRRVQLSVVVQKMVFPQAAGILFTADPLTSNRKVSSIDASFGLGEAVVAGLVNADTYRIRDGRIVDRKISAKKLEIRPLSDGGTEEREIEPEERERQALTDDQIVELERLGRRIEEHFGRSQDIEWCLAEGVFHIVQSRPITTLYPIPEAGDQENHLYVSVGHQQMMTDPIKPLGLSLFRLTSPRPMYTAGGRLFVDIAPELASPAGREVMVNVLGKSDPLIRSALINVLERGDFIASQPEDEPASAPGKAAPLPDYRTLADYDPAIVAELIGRGQASIETLKHDILTKSGVELLDFIVEDIQRRQKDPDHPQSFGVIMTGMNASAWINEKMKEWLEETNVADTISQSAPNNITSEMGLALLDVADVVRPHPAIIDYLEHGAGDDCLDELPSFEGGSEVRDAILAYLDRYGMRCAGEIDITRTRWSEKPSTLIPMILGNIRNFEPGASRRKFEQGLAEASRKERELLERLRELPDGESKATETKRMIDLVRNFIGYREYPKYGIVSRYFVYKQALMKEAERLEHAGVIGEKEDIYYLTFEELREAIRTNQVDGRIIAERKEAYRTYEKLTPPRILTSDGEIITGAYRRDHLPADAIVGLAVSSGVIEGRARVILRMEDADLEPGDILVTSFTDPSWTPLFVSIRGLVTEVGGLMTHGAVIAREYGIPAVVGVENATRLIKDGERIRVNGTEGFVEVV